MGARRQSWHLSFSLPLCLSQLLCMYFQRGEHEQGALWVLEMTQLPSPEIPGHAHRAKSVALAESIEHGRGDLAQTPPAPSSWQLRAGVGFLIRWCCCAFLRAKGWGSCCLQAQPIHRALGERLLR